MTTKPADAGGDRRFGRLGRLGVSLVAAAVLLGTGVAGSWWLTAPHLVDPGPPPVAEVEQLSAADASHRLFAAGPSGGPTARGGLAVERDGRLLPVESHDRAALRLVLPTDAPLRLLADPAAGRPLGDGLVIEVFRGENRHARALIGTAERVIDADLRLLPSYGPGDGALPRQGLPLTRLLPEGEPATLVIDRLALGGPPPDGGMVLAIGEASAAGVEGVRP